MKRSIGVTVIAVLSLLGSLFTFLMGALVAVVPFFISKAGRSEPPFPPGLLKLMMVMAALMYVLPAIWGIITSIGLFRLREWARISIIVFSVLLILMSGFGGLMFLVMPIPPTPNQAVDASVTTGLRIFMAAFTGTLLSIGIWWLVFFTRARVKQQFAPPQPGAAAGPVAGTLDAVPDLSARASAPVIPGRPLSLAILAWYMLSGCLFIPLSLLLRSPAIFLTWILTGWAATVYFLVFALAHLYIGVGLLRLKPLARTTGVAYFAFVFVNMAVFYLAPGGRLRFLDMMQKSQASFPWMPPRPALDWTMTQLFNTPFFVLMACFGLVWILVPIYFLITRKEALERAAAAAAGHDLTTSVTN